MVFLYRQSAMYRSAVCSLLCVLFSISPIYAECWVGHERPLNSTEPRDNTVSERPGGKTLTITILDETGKPMPKAKFSYFGDPSPHQQKGFRHYVETNDEGKFTIAFKPDAVQKMFQIEVDQPGYAPYNAAWEKPDTDPIPGEFSIQLEKAAAVGGIIVDDTGKPLQDADVEFCVHWEHRSRTPQICSYRVWVKTDVNGVWSCNLIPPSMLKTGAVHFNASYKDFMPYEMYTPLVELVPHTDGSFKNTVRLERGVTVKGRITDTDGKPIADALVFGNYMSTREDFETKTNENGEYVLENWPESETAYIGVWSPGKMSLLKDFIVERNSSPIVDIVMKPAGEPLKIRIVDKEGKPVKGYYVCIERWGEHRLVSPILQTGKDRPQTDENGYWVWKEAPENEVVFDMFERGSFMDLRNKPMTAREEEYVFTAFPPLKVTGKVLDAETGEAVPTFKVFWGSKFEMNADFYWGLQANAGKEGFYSLSESYPQNSFGVKIEAEGYESAISRDIKPEEGTITIDFSLKKLSAAQLSKRLQGVVLTPDGKPAANATVALSTPKVFLYVDNGKFRNAKEPYITKTDKNGAFQFAYIDFAKERLPEQNDEPGEKVSDYTLYVSHDSGFRRLTQDDKETEFKTKPITLEKWGRIEGTVHAGTQPSKEMLLYFSPSFSQSHWDYSAVTDAEGQFVFAQVPVCQGSIQQGIPTGKRRYTMANGVNVDILSDKTTVVKIGGDGRPVTGKLIFDNGSHTAPDWSFCTVRCCLSVAPPDHTAYSELAKKIPAFITKELDPEKLEKLLTEWKENTEEGKVFAAAQKEYQESNEKFGERALSAKLCTVSPEGTFRLDDVPEGNWQLEVELKAGDSWDSAYIGTLVHRFTMGAIPGGVSDEPMDVGTLTVKSVEQPKPLIQAGQTAPDFELQRIFPTAKDGTRDESQKDAKLRLSDYKGKMVILDFWATWCVPCMQKMPQLKKLHELVKDDPRVVMVGISFDNKNAAENLGQFIAEKELPWIHGLAGNLLESPFAEDYGISSIPTLLLLDGEGKVIASNPSIEELAKKIEEMRKKRD